MIHGQPVTCLGANGYDQVIDINGWHDVKKSAYVTVDVKPVPLWTNPDPTENFGPQKINANTDRYDYFIFEVAESTSNRQYKRLFVLPKFARATSGDITLYKELFVTSDSWRGVESIGDGAITFGPGFFGNSGSPSYGIPLRVWGMWWSSNGPEEVST